MRCLAVSLCVAAGSCATVPAPSASPSAAQPPTAAASSPTASRGRDMGRPGVDPPRYKPSSSSPEPMAITDVAYGDYPAAAGAPALGERFPDFELPLSDGGTYRLADARGAGPVLVMFYRGFW